MYYKFNPDSNYTEEQLKQTQFFALYEKAMNTPEKLTRDEKDYIFKNTEHGVHKCMGWCLVFETMKTYLVRFKETHCVYPLWHEYKAYDKTSIRTAYKWVCTIGIIVELTINEKGVAVCS